MMAKLANFFSYDVALAYKQSSRSVQKVDGKQFIETEVCPQAGDAILDLGCGTGELSVTAKTQPRSQGLFPGLRAGRASEGKGPGNEVVRKLRPPKIKDGAY